jgi:NADH:ubiquinone oxidoreductase subunit 3 (subunit A)
VKEPEYQIIAKWILAEQDNPYSYRQFEQAFWHLWTLNCYHITLSFDVNMVLLLDWAISYHLELGDK